MVRPSCDVFLQGLQGSMRRNHVTVFVPSPPHVNPPVCSHIGCAQASSTSTAITRYITFTPQEVLLFGYCSVL